MNDAGRKIQNGETAAESGRRGAEVARAFVLDAFADRYVRGHVCGAPQLNHQYFGSDDLLVRRIVVNADFGDFSAVMNSDLSAGTAKSYFCCSRLYDLLMIVIAIAAEPSFKPEFAGERARRECSPVCGLVGSSDRPGACQSSD